MFKHIVLMILFFPLALMGQGGWSSYFQVLQDYNTRDEIKHNISNELTDDLAKQLKVNPDIIIDDEIPLHKVATEDKQLFIYTWHYSFQDASSNYGGVLVYKKNVYPLYFSMSAIDEEEVYSALRWGGGLYYEILPMPIGDDTVYTLLAWDGNNGVTYKKVIDVLSFNRKGEPEFGASLFYEQGRKLKRMVFEYSAEMSLLLTYDDEAACIVTNALYSNDERFSGVQEYYSASDVFNVLRFENDLWVLYNDVDLRLDKKESKRLSDSGVEASSGL